MCDAACNSGITETAQRVESERGSSVRVGFTKGKLFRNVLFMMTRIESLDFNHRTREDESFIPKSYPHPEVYCSPSVDMNHIIVPLARARTAIVLYNFLTAS